MDMTKDWICFRCHRTNASYVTACACGINKRRCAKFYETGVDPYAEQEAEEIRVAAEREKALENIREQQSNYGPKTFDDNVVVEVEQASRQGTLERKMTNMLKNVADKATSLGGTPEPEDRLGRYRQQQAASPASADPAQEDREPKFDEWKCPNCGSINNKYTEVCGCGFTQTQARIMKQGASMQQNLRTAPAAAQPAAAPSRAVAPVTPPPIPEQPARPQNRTTPQNPAYNPVRSRQPVAVPGVSRTNQRPGAYPGQQPGPRSVPVQRPMPRTNQGAASQAMGNQSSAPADDSSREPYFDEWKCPMCGTINNDYVTACSCGCTQRRAKRIMQQGGQM